MVKPDNAHRAVRRTKGQKANRKKMATVAAVFARQPWVRTPEQVVESLFRGDTKFCSSMYKRGTHKKLKHLTPTSNNLSYWLRNSNP